MPEIPALGKWRQEDYKFEETLISKEPTNQQNKSSH
jgi:hypothetical protein